MYFTTEEECSEAFSSYYNIKVLLDVIANIGMIVCIVLLCKFHSELQKESSEKKEKKEQEKAAKNQPQQTIVYI